MTVGYRLAGSPILADCRRHFKLARASAPELAASYWKLYG